MSYRVLKVSARPTGRQVDRRVIVVFRSSSLPEYHCFGPANGAPSSVVTSSVGQHHDERLRLVGVVLLRAER